MILYFSIIGVTALLIAKAFWYISFRVVLARFGIHNYHDWSFS